MWIVVGLGNPGRRYAVTRHNVGFTVVERLAKGLGARLRRKKYAARVADAVRNEERLVLAEPQTYMNLSGTAVRELADGYRVPASNVLVVADDLDIGLGQIRVRKSGSGGTHNGLRSVVAELGTPVFPRLRVGIGPLPERGDAEVFVLSPFSRREIPGLEEGLSRAGEALEMILDGRIDAAMNAFNQRGGS